MIDLLPQTNATLFQATQSASTNKPELNGASFEKKARETAEEFEAVMLNTLTKTMMSGLKSDGPFGGGQSEEMYRSLQAEEMAKAIADTGGIGLSDMIYREIIRLQEAKDQ